MRFLVDRLKQTGLIVGLLLVLSACRQLDLPQTPPPPSPRVWQQDIGPLLERVGETRTRLWLQALQRQCATTRPGDAALCAAGAGLDPAQASWARIQRQLREGLVWQCGARGLLTGYYEPILSGSRQSDRPGQAPLYALEGEALRAFQARSPWLSREQIERQAAAAGLRPIAWVDDPVEAFFLHIQGSGRIRLRDEGNRLLRVGYAGHNGQPYKAIGAVMIERGWLEAGQVSAQSIKQWLRAQRSGDGSAQARARDLMNENPRYVFFRSLPASLSEQDGPPGSMGLPLTAQASVAADPLAHAPGSLLMLRTREDGDRLVQVQDVGSAIKGEGRIDLFTGSGDEAGEMAGRLKAPLQVIRLAARAAVTAGSAARPDAPGAQSESAIALANCSAGI